MKVKSVICCIKIKQQIVYAFDRNLHHIIKVITALPPGAVRLFNFKRLNIRRRIYKFVKTVTLLQ